MNAKCFSQQESDPCHDRVYPTQLHVCQSRPPPGGGPFRRRHDHLRRRRGAVAPDRTAHRHRAAVRRLFPRSSPARAGRTQRAPSWSPSASTGWRWVTRTSTITISCVPTRCWPCSAASKTSKANSAAEPKTAATPAPARAPSTASKGPRPTPARKAVTRRSFSTRARWSGC